MALPRLPPVALALLAATGMWASGRVLPSPAVEFPGHHLMALILSAVGAGFALAGVIAFRRAGTTVNPLTPESASTIVRAGVYAVSRNPMYVGLLAVLTAWAVWLSHFAAFLWLPAVFAWLDRVQIPAEERALRARFGDAFDSYRSAVRRWL